MLSIANAALLNFRSKFLGFFVGELPEISTCAPRSPSWIPDGLLNKEIDCYLLRWSWWEALELFCLFIYEIINIEEFGLTMFYGLISSSKTTEVFLCSS